MLLKILAWMVLVAIVFVTVSPIEWRPQDILPVDADRALACALLGGLFTLAYPRHWFRVGFVMIAGAGLIEVLQVFSPTRHARLDDALVKASGAFAGVFVSALLVNAGVYLRRYRRHRKPRLIPGGTDPVLSASMQQLPIQSQMIEALFFRPEDGQLVLRFRNGEERLFTGVPYSEALAMTQSESPGRYYTERIRSNYRRLAA